MHSRDKKGHYTVQEITNFFGPLKSLENNIIGFRQKTSIKIFPNYSCLLTLEV